jgi:hypothetical protein
MNPTDKMEAQLAVTDDADGGAIVVLPEGEENPQAQSAQDNDPAGNDLDNGGAGNDLDDAAEREKIREARREERKLKKQLHREKAKESSSLINALRKQNEALANRLAAVEKKTSGAELARVDKAIEDAGVEVEYAKMKLTEAVGSGDGQGVTRAQEMWYEAKRKLESLQSVKQNATRQMAQAPQQNIQVPDPMVQKMAADWMEDNPWYDPHGGNEESQMAQIIDKRLTEEGFDPSTEDYWDELSDRMARFVPRQSAQTQSRAKPRSVMTSSGRESTATTKSNEFRLSPERVAALKEAGAWDNPELKQRMIKRFADYDRQQKLRG